VPGSLPPTPGSAGTGSQPIAEAAALGDVTAQAALVSGSWPGAAAAGQPIPAALPASAAALLHVADGDVLRMKDRNGHADRDRHPAAAGRRLDVLDAGPAGRPALAGHADAGQAVLGGRGHRRP
jgi:hypothetical protein